jgi:peptidoglycan hydrolase-like protein with peptidoglycan-binding domain
MAKKIIRLTESELAKVIGKVITEQSEERNMTRAIQKFLNQKMKAGLEPDGKTGRNSATEAAISKYQSKIGVYPADGVWGENTWNKMPEQDRKLLKDLTAKEGGLVDTFLNWLGV